MNSPGIINLYVNVFTKKLVNVNGSPTSIPEQFYGDVPVFSVYPVRPVSANAAQGFAPVNLAGYTMNLTMAGAPNATSPPAHFAYKDNLTWDAVNSCFTGEVILTGPEIYDYIGDRAERTAYICFDVFDPGLGRTTILQAPFQIKSSIDYFIIGPAEAAPRYITPADALNMFVQIGAVPGKRIDWLSNDGAKKKTMYLGNDGTMQFETIT